MRSTLSTVATLSVLSLATAQTFTECNPTKKSCAADPGLGTSTTTDFTKGKSADWTYADATVMSYGDQGAEFVVKSANDAPTISFDKYIMFGKVSVTMLASAGQGIVSSFILESDDLDEIDWEWLGSTDSSVESNFFGKGNTTTYDRAVYHPIATPVETSHTYTIDWNKDAITWSIDGATVRTLAYDDPKTLGGTNYPQTPMKIKMGSWIGCADAAAAANPASQGTCEWAGGPVDLTKGPYTMSVASVVIEDYGCGGDYTYSDMTGSYTSIKSSGSCDGIANDSSPSSTSASATQTSSAAQSSSAAQTSSSATQTSSSSSTSGGLLIETSSISSSTVTKPTSATAKTTDSSASASTTTTTDSSTKSSSGAANGAASTTLATSATSKSSATSTSSTASPSLVQSSQANSEKPKHSFGAVELTVVALGLGLGYLVM